MTTDLLSLGIHRTDIRDFLVETCGEAVCEFDNFIVQHIIVGLIFYIYEKKKTENFIIEKYTLRHSLHVHKFLFLFVYMFLILYQVEVFINFVSTYFCLVLTKISIKVYNVFF